MNKKGGEKWLSIWWYFCIAVIVAGTVISTWQYQAVSDASQLDANVLVNRIAGCIIADGKLAFTLDEQLDITKLCHMKFPDKDYFFDVQVYAIDECKKIPETQGLECAIKKDFPFAPKEYKNGDLRDRCINLEGIKVTTMPDCVYKTIYAVGQDNKQYVLRVIGGTHE